MTQRLNAFYSMWTYSAIDRSCWEHKCKINDILGDIIDIAELIENDFEHQFLYESSKDSFWLKGIGFYPNDFNVVPAVLNVQFQWDSIQEQWQLESYQIVDDNLNDVNGGENYTILGRNV